MSETKIPTPPEALRIAANQLDAWANGGGKDDRVLNELFAEICAVHDTLLDLIRRKPQFGGVVESREKYLGIEELRRLHAAAIERATRAEVQLAGCGAAAMGAISPHADEAVPGDYGYSASYGEVVKIRRELEKLRERMNSKLPF